MTDTAVWFEPFHEAPAVDDVVACLRKVLNHRHARTPSRRDGAERSWLRCAGRPDTAIGALRAAPSDGWPRGFYDLGGALPLSLVVLSELDDGDDTLPLRLMGTGPTLRAALHALRTMEDHAEGEKKPESEEKRPSARARRPAPPPPTPLSTASSDCAAGG